MKKYYFKESGKELEFGDYIKLDLTKDTEDGHTRYHHIEGKFIPELVDVLLEEGVIEESEEEDEENTLDFLDEDFINGILEANEELEKRVDTLEGEVKTIKLALTALSQSKDI